MHPELIVVGHTNIDINHTPLKETVLPGGAGYFSSIAASRILPQVGLVTRIGKDFDASFLLTRVLPDGIHIDKTGASGKSIQTYHSETDTSERDIIVELGVNADLSPQDIPISWLKSINIVHIATMPPDQQFAFIEYFRQESSKTLISLDTDIYLVKQKIHNDSIRRNLLSVDLAFVNRLEYNALKNEIDQLPFAVVKLDKDGAMYLKYGKPIICLPTNPVSVVDATGAGDVFAGTFLACQTIGIEIKRSLQTAIEVATQSVTRQGIMHLFTF